MLVFCILVFAIVMFFISFLIGKQNDFDMGKVASYVTIVAWSSLIFGLYLGRMAP